MTQHILVADDEPDIETLITMHFRRDIRKGKYLFTFAKNGEEAYQQILRTPDIDMVLTDINMPVMTGLTLLHKLNALAQPPKTVVVSAYGDMPNIRQAMHNGAFDFMVKPIESKDLTITLERTLEAVAKEKANREQLHQAQVQLVQSEKLSALGQMVAGVAHEINNPVNFIYGNLDYAKESVDDLMAVISLYQKRFPEADSEIKACLQDIDIDFLKTDLTELFSSLEMGATRIRELVLSLKDFSRIDDAEKKTVDIHEGIESTLIILNNRLKATSLRPDIQVIRKFGLLSDVDCHPSQLNQVIMNILANAIDALDEWSEQYSFDALTERPNTIQIETEAIDQNWIRIVITDNGPGISEDASASLFDPFFTTKPVGKGTGLGMAISYKIIVEKHGGKLYFTSNANEGTRFVIELPTGEAEQLPQ